MPVASTAPALVSTVTVPAVPEKTAKLPFHASETVPVMSVQFVVLPADQVPVSPVNVFRTVFRHYFALDLPPLPDRYFIYRDDESLYSYDDVTDRLPR